MKVITQQFKLKRLVLITGLVFGMTACNTDDLAPPPPPPRINSVPVIISDAVTVSNEGQPYAYALTATDADADSLTYSSSDSSWLTIDTATGLLSGTPTLADVGDIVVTITVTDGTDSATQEFTIAVQALPLDNVAPEFTSDPVVMGDIETAYSYAVTAADANFDDLTFTAPTLPDWATFDMTTNTLSGQPEIPGSYPVELTVTDGTLDISQSFNILITGPAVVTTELVVFETFELPEWALWGDAAAETDVVTDDLEHDQVAQFTITGATVAGFDSRDAGTPFDASEFASNGQFSFEMKVVTAPTAGEATPWFLKLEAADGSSTTLPGFVDIQLTSSNEGLAPVTGEWQTYTFDLADLTPRGLNPSEITIFMIFPAYGPGEGAVYLVDNVKIVSVVGGVDAVDPNGPELLTNGNFEGGTTGWTAGDTNIVADGANSFFEVDVTAAGNPWDVNLSQVMTLIPNTTYVFSFKAKASVERSMIAGPGLNADPWHSAVENPQLTTDWQTFTYTITTVNDADGTPFGDDNSRILFDMGAEVGMVSIDDVSLKVKDGGDTGGDTGGDVVVNEALTNGDFEDGLTSWKDDVGAVVADGDNMIFEAVIETASTFVYDVNQTQVFDIIEGATYTFSFRAKASLERTMIAGLGLNSGTFNSIAETIELTTEWQTFTTDIVATGIGGVGSRVFFDMGLFTGTINIDDVSVQVKDGGDPVVDPVVLEIGDEALTNGDFENGLASWKDNVGEVVADGDNMIFEAVIETASTFVYDVNQTQVFDIIEGATYTFSFRAKASLERTMIAGLGLNSGTFNSIAETIELTTEWQTFTTDIVATGIGGVGSRVFFDMGLFTGTINIDDVSVILLAAE
ncbi:carbohydrate binding domain-containing protein [Paraglaciecola sp. MB-3u-78]|uniref:carbohydrate binding domain-containing protein n=1 Tax=Paraglaciecola sp. MB-3u-78 TaxID=2058332 RepID=UPI000C33A474|nr:carbohydrate binding domain-containing protein [Paraglaciecola sp. MB-3u-78]PKG99278.1 hypothetical protein CXF95_08390 [Paraglaciecola sp. MB-3u-78]